jgi:hypothetical protein
MRRAEDLIRDIFVPLEWKSGRWLYIQSDNAEFTIANIAKAYFGPLSVGVIHIYHVLLRKTRPAQSESGL